MLREQSRFAIVDDAGRPYEVIEVIAFRILGDGGEVASTAPTMFTTAGMEVFPAHTAGEYCIPRIGATARRR